MNTPEIEFQEGQVVSVRTPDDERGPDGKSCEPARAIVRAVRDKTVMDIDIQNPPEWFLRKLRSRGIFIGYGQEYPLSLFLDHKQQWTDTSLLGHYVITPEPKERPFQVVFGMRKDDSQWIAVFGPGQQHSQFDWNGTFEQSQEIERLVQSHAALLAACKHFIAKVERKEATSTESYNEMTAAIALAERKPDEDL